MTIMFTHKRVEAWDTLSQALFEAGFMITATWPIHTESEHSLHQAKECGLQQFSLFVVRELKRIKPPGGTKYNIKSTRM